MAPKSKTPAEQAPAQEPAAKKAKAEEAAGDESKKEEDAKFVEPDAVKDNRAALKQQISFEVADLTLNAIPTMEGKMLMALTDGAMGFLTAGARGNVGQVAGRHLIEAKIVQFMHPSASPAYGRNQQPPRQLFRIGFSTSASSLILGDDDQSVCFDSDGSFIAEKRPQRAPQHRTISTAVMGVVLNLDAKSPNFNTVALYIDGKLASDPKPLPECLKNKPLFPHVCYRNVSIHTNFGPTALAELPFKCRMLQSAAQSDVAVAASTASKDGKFEVLMPVAFPDEGTFDWLDSFLEKNPKYVELSDRKLLDWARASGMWPRGDRRNDRKISNDKPNFDFGIPSMDDLSVRRVLTTVAPTMPRNYVVMEVKSNLIAEERKETLKRFNNPCYKKIARVVMGDPSDDFKALVRKRILKEKQDKSDHEWRIKKSDREREIAADLRRKEEAAKREEAAEQKKKEEEEAKAKKDAEKPAEEAKEEKAAEEKPAEEKAAEEPAKDEAMEEKKDEDAEKKEEEKKDEEKKDEEKKEEEEKHEIDEQTEPPPVELNEEELAQAFLPKRWPDLAGPIMNRSYAHFSTPEKAEGFDDVAYEWDSCDKAKEYLKTWIINKKLNTRIEELKPGQSFTTRAADFATLFKGWQEKTRSLEKKEPVEKDAAADDEDDSDIFALENISDMGDGLPLFHKFESEDWALTLLRFELFMLAISFKKDCEDPDRTGIPLDHVAFYYYKYFNKVFNAEAFGVTENTDVFEMVKDAVTVKDGLLVSTLPEDHENVDIFVKRTEAGRRSRQRRIDAGDETARLKFPPPPAPGAPPPPPPDARRDHHDGDRRDYRDHRDHRDYRDRRDGPTVPMRSPFVPVRGKDKDKGKGKGKDKDKGKPSRWS